MLETFRPTCKKQLIKTCDVGYGSGPVTCKCLLSLAPIFDQKARYSLRKAA